MSRTLNDSPDPNDKPDPDEVGSSSSEKDPNSTSEDQNAQTRSEETPLPDFKAESSRFEPSEAPIRSSSASPRDLGDLLSDQKTGRELKTDESVSDSVYKVSSAEPDLSSHILSSSEEPLLEGQEEDTTSTWQTVWSITREVGETIILTLVIFFIIQLVIRNFRVVGTSMVNNLHDGQYLIIDKISYSPIIVDYLGLGGPERGDVVVFRPPRNPGDDYVKRIIGLPGETVQVIKGQVYINDQLLEEPFEPLPASYSMPAPVMVPEGQVFVLGDNRNNSNDSHNWGPLPVDNIVGRAWVSYWPPDQWGAIPRDAPTEEATLKHFLNQLIPSASAQNEQ